MSTDPNRFRPQLNALEERATPAVGLPPALPGTGITPRTFASFVGNRDVSNVLDVSGRHQQPTFTNEIPDWVNGSTYRQSVVTIANQTNRTLAYWVAFPGSGGWKRFRLPPNQYRIHTIEGARIHPVVKYDGNFQAGNQWKVHRIHSKRFDSFAGAMPTKPDQGRIYVFRVAPNNLGVQLYRV